MAGNEWLRCFYLVVDQAEAKNLSRGLQSNASKAILHSTQVTVVLSQHEYSALKIWNVDETGISTVQKPAQGYCDERISFGGAHNK
jgi:hypothetical protein